MKYLGTDIQKIAEEWKREFPDINYASDWTELSDELEDQSRWCTHWRKVLKHDSGMLIAIHYPRNTGDGESAGAYEITWCEVEEKETVVKEWPPIKGGAEGTIPASL